MKSRFVALALSLAVMGTAAGATHAQAGKPAKNIVQVAREAGQFTTLLKAVEVAGLTGTLSGQGKGPFTVFAPTDAAFAALPPGTLDALIANPAALKGVLLYHVLAGEFPAAQVVAASTLPTVNGQSLAVTTGGGAKVNGANIVVTDIRARNGIIHVIDAVLVPR